MLNVAAPVQSAECPSLSPPYRRHCRVSHTWRHWASW